ASRAAKERCDEGYGVGPTGQSVYLDFREATERYGRAEAHQRQLDHPTEEQILHMGREVIREKYGNLFDMYRLITGENPDVSPMRIYPAMHYTMGGLWVDYELMTTIPGLFALGECNFSDHGANRLGASALMQGLADGYFVIPYSLGNYLAGEIRTNPVPLSDPAFSASEKAVQDQLNRLMGVQGKYSVDHFHKELGKIMWDHCGMARNQKGLEQAISWIGALREEFWKGVRIPGKTGELNPELEKAGRVADFLELGELTCLDALDRRESCGGHFREEYQTPEGEALRDDEHFCYVAAWEWKGGAEPALHKEPLEFEVMHPTQRNYK
ncbi:MAG TPA: FAD-binding protein, partial [Chitinophagaceae bacterium]|nr:FAD-binding protein [Chitinophagaceae bacterium]